MILFDQDKNIFYSSLINSTGFFSAFGTKQTGDGIKLQTIANFLYENDIQYQSIVVPEQIHSTNLEFIANCSEKQLEVKDTDGVITSLEKVVLTVRTADCIPVIYADAKSGLIGISHNGWRGTLKKLQLKVIEKMISLGAKKENIVVALGPGVGMCCYPVDQDRYYTVLEEYNTYSNSIFRMHNGQYYLNLLLLNYLILHDYGIMRNKIDFFPFCTSCDKNRFFSLRRDGKNKKEEMFSLVMKQ